MKHLIHLGVIVVFLHFSFSILAQSNSSSDYELRPLFELDQLSTGEGYPWISDDGLRIYYTAHNPLLNVSSIWYSQRANTDSNFEAHKILTCNSEQFDNLSPWLSQDEKTLAFVQRTAGEERETEIFISKRASKEDAFDDAQQITLQGGIKGAVISPSFTQDLQRLFIFNEYKSHSYILEFEQVEEYVYKYKAEVKFPKPYIVKAGKLSHDGLEYYISLDKRKDKPSLFILKRNSLLEDFVSLNVFESDLINHPEHRNHQVFFSSDKSFIVFTRSIKNRWESNSIFIAQNINRAAEEIIIPIETPVLENDIILNEIIVFPNPSIDEIYFKNVEAKAIEVNIFDSSGRKVRTLKNLSDDIAVNISGLLPGSYYLRCIDSTTGNFRVIKHIKL